MFRWFRALGLLAATFASPAVLGATQAHAQVFDPLKPQVEDEAAEDDLLQPDEPVAEAKPAAPVVKRKRRIAVEDLYAPQGIGLGGLRLYPVLEASGVTGTDTRAGARLRPSARLASDWSRHSWETNANADFTYGFPEHEITDLTASAQSRVRVDIRRGFTGTLDARYSLERTPDFDSEVPDAAASDRIDQVLSAAGVLEKEFGRLRLTGRGGAVVQLYDDVELNSGGTEDNSDREFVEPELSARLTYDSGANLKPFGEVAYRPRIHFKGRDRNGLDRDSAGYVLSAGVTFDDAPFWTGDLALNYIIRDYDDRALGTARALGFSGALTWRPTELTEIVFNAGTGIEESASAANGGSPNYTLSAIVTHSPREYLSLNAGIGMEFADIAGAGGDLTITPRTGFVYRLSPELAIVGGASVEWFDPAGAGETRTDYTVSAGVEVRR